MENHEYAVSLEAEFTYDGEKLPALETGDNYIEDGKCVVLCGSSGCGKTTLLRCINQLIPQFYEGELRGFCRISGRDLSGLSIGETGRLCASVFQDPRSQFFTLNSTLEVAFGLENFGIARAEMEARVQAAFSDFGLTHLMNRDVFSLSSGERQLVAIMAAWALDTDVFLLDEPTANLDYCAIKDLSKALKDLKKQGKTMVISEHRLYYLADIADEFWYMSNGKILQKLTRDEMLALTDEERKNMGLRSLDLGRLNCCKAVPAGSGREFCADNISFGYKKGKTVLNGLSLSAKSGEVTGLIGHNGCGKTTFGKLSAGLFQASGGTLRLDGKVMTAKQLQTESIFIMQEAEFQFFTNSVMNELCYGRKMSESDKLETEELLKTAGLWECRNRHPFSLSGGQMQRLVLLLAYMSPKPVVVLDEPTAGLDYGSLCRCAELIDRMRQKKIVFVITHDLELISKSCTRCFAIENGKVRESFDMTSEDAFDGVRKYMESLGNTQVTPKQPPAAEVRAPGRSFDPRTKLLVFVLSMIAGIGTNTGVILAAFAASMVVLLFEKRWKALLSGIVLMGGMYLLYGMFPGVATAFLISFFPRMLVICYGVLLLSGKNEAARTLAALRKLRVPEGIIMVISVTLRFFPVLGKDLKLMGQSIRTRGFFPTFSDKIRAVPQYLEIMVVPMVFRVIRIAEALSASAETRGIALKNRRDSIIPLEIRAGDIVMMVLALVLFAAGLVI